MLIEMNNVSKKYKNKTAVDHISLSVNEGEVFGLIGPNGAGKSTVVAMLGTLLKVDEGEILYGGTDITKKPDSIRKNLGYVPQDIALYAMLSGYDNLMFWGKVYHIPKDNLKNRIEKVKDLMGLSENQLKQNVCTYSGGMKRRLNIGVALLHDPKLVLMDEPTVGIDIQSVSKILDIIKQLRIQRVTVIYTGHIMDEIEEICDKICIMNDGKILVLGSQEELLYKEKGKISLREYYLEILNQKA